LIIVINAVSAKSGGAVTYLYNLVCELVKSEHKIILCVPVNFGKSFQSLGDNFKIVATDVGYKSSWKRILSDQFVLRNLVNNEKADVLLSSSDFGMFLPPCKQILMVRNPLFFSSLFIQQILPNKSWRFKVSFFMRRWLILLSIKSSDLVVTATRSMSDDVSKFITIPKEKAVVNPFGVPLEKFQNNLTKRVKLNESHLQFLPENPFKLLYVSEYSDYKNLTILLRAFLLLKVQEIKDVSLTSTLDPGQFKNVEVISRGIDWTLANHSLVKPSVKFTGSIPYQEIHKLYQECNAFVFPSLAESFGHPLVEAMASGLPIIASDIPVNREICGDAAVYFNPLDPADCVHKILLLKTNPNLREKLKEIGLKRVSSRFDWKDHVNRFYVTLEQATGSGS
jgi:glycosyltransferase involved in cell wall biosynthesis